MSDFHYDLRDLRFNLFDLLKLGELSKNERYAEFDEATIGDVCEFALSQATEIFAPMNAVGDVKGTRLVDGQVITPEGWKDMYDQYVEAGWNGLHQPVEKGGQGCPMAVGIGVQALRLQPLLHVILVSVGALGRLRIRHRGTKPTTWSMIGSGPAMCLTGRSRNPCARR